jgi:single-strand DNA-binding protein
MAKGLNKVMVIGNLGKAPELRSTPGGMRVAQFSLAVSEQWKDKQSGDQKERTEWIHCEVWGKLASVCAEYLHKGSKVYVCGKFRTDEWDDKDGIKRYTTKVRVDEMLMLGGTQGGQSRTTTPSKSDHAAAAAGEKFDDDIPF